jgi:glutathione S-transferase
MQVFGALLSPYVRKVCLVAEEKGIDYELVLSSPHGTHPDFIAASPFGKIPAIKDGDYSLSDSSAIVAYLDAKHTEVPLLPNDPCALGKSMLFDEYADTILAASGTKVLFNRLVAPKLLKLPYDEARAAEGEAELPTIYDYLESVAPENGWLVGESFTLGDISVASVLRSVSAVGVEPKAERYPRINAWYARVRERPAWQKIAAVEDAPRKKG